MEVEYKIANNDAEPEPKHPIKIWLAKDKSGRAVLMANNSADGRKGVDYKVLRLEKDGSISLYSSGAGCGLAISRFSDEILFVKVNTQVAYAYEE